MKKSVFARVLTTYISILMLLQIAQSVLLLKLYHDDTLDREKKNLLDETILMGRLVNPVMLMNANPIMIDLLKTCAREFSTDESITVVWVIDTDGHIVYEVDSTGRVNDNAGNHEDTMEQGKLVQDDQLTNNSEIQKILNKESPGIFVTHGLYDDWFNERTLTSGIPIGLYSPDGKTMEVVVGGLVINTPNDVHWVSARVLRPIFYSALGTLLVGLFLITWASSKLTDPLRQMNRMVREISRGNFGFRAEIHGRDEMAELATEFNKMAEELKKQEDLRRGFVANVSHELKSPLTSVQGFAQGMLDGTISAEEHANYLSIILDETKRLNKLIRELLDLSQIESGKFPLHMTRFDINETIRRVLIRFLDVVDSKGIDIEVDFRQEYAYVIADADRIEQVLVNLIDNAVKYTPEGGKITLWTHGSSDKLHVSVSDTGIGIPDEDLPFIFERFYKVDKSHTDKKGTGLGLSIVKRIIDQHGQSVTVNSQLGKGTTFVFSLKRSEDQNNIQHTPNT